MSDDLFSKNIDKGDPIKIIEPTDVIGNIRFFNCDSRDFVKQVQSNFYNVGFYDPPYGIGMSKPAGNSQKYSRKKLKDNDWDNEAMSPGFFLQAQRIAADQVIWGANHFAENLPSPRNSKCWLIWDKREGFIPERTYADAEIAWASFDSPIRVFRFHWDGFLQKIKEKRIHPTQKPVSLYEWKLMKFCKEGDKIVDLFGGSFSVAIACYKQGFALDIVERDPIIYADGLARFKEHIQQGTLF